MRRRLIAGVITGVACSCFGQPAASDSAPSIVVERRELISSRSRQAFQPLWQGPQYRHIYHKEYPCGVNAAYDDARYLYWHSRYLFP